MYQVSIYQLRPSTDVEFVEDSAEMLDHVKINYIDTGKVVSWRVKEFVDSDQLILKKTTVWTDKSHYDQWMQDPIGIEHGKRINDLNIERGITLLNKEVSEV